MHVAVWATHDDATGAALGAALRARGHDVTWLTPGGHAADATDLSSWVIAGTDLDAADVHVIRALPTPFVTPGPGASAADLARRAFEAHERRDLALAALWDAEASGRRVVNPLRSLAFEAKPTQLAALHRAGLPLPRTLVTSMPLAAERFVEALAREGAQAIVKPSVGGATARLVDERVRARLATLKDSPLILQERITGDDLRVTVVNGAVVSAVVIESGALDYRDDAAYAAGAARYHAVALAPSERALAAQVASCVGHTVSGIDLKRRADGALVVLEANAAPRWLDIEEKTGAPITAAVVAALEGTAA